MKNLINSIRFSFILLTLALVGCEDIFYKNQPLVLLEEENYKDWVDYRSAELGLYALQQNLVEQLVVLGELRGDLIKTTENAESDLIDIQDFNISPGNKYASADNFYKLISACNALIRTLEMNHPEVLEDNPQATDYHRVYGEALCMRAWAYFNAVRIYGEVPLIPEELTNYEDVIDFVMNPGVDYYIDSGRYVYDINGLDLIDVNDTVFYPNDTVYTDTIHFETFPRRFVDMQTIVDYATYDLTERLNYVGVEHGLKEGIGEEGEIWESIIWTDYSKSYLLGQMAMFMGNINGALEYFNPLLYNYDNERFGLYGGSALDYWNSIFTTINTDEHILVFWFDKSKQQTHELQRLFDNSGTNLYYLKPTKKAIDFWETEWTGQSPIPSELLRVNTDNTVTLYPLTDPGEAGDFYRGPNVSYRYKVDGDLYLSNESVEQMLLDKQNEKYVDVEARMLNIDTIVYKYSNNKDAFDNDAHVCLYRAASVHLYASEICVFSQYEDDGSQTRRVSQAPKYFDGTYRSDLLQLGVRGRLDLYQKEIDVNKVVIQDPFTNKVIGYRDFTAESGGDPTLEFLIKQQYYEEFILDERAKEFAFEGERFYDIMRIAQRRKDPAFLANTIADAKGKYSPEKREEIRSKLMNMSNWYVPFYINY